MQRLHKEFLSVEVSAALNFDTTPFAKTQFPISGKESVIQLNIAPVGHFEVFTHCN